MRPQNTEYEKGRMKMLTYKQLFEFLKTLTEEELEQTITVYDTNNDEYYPVTDWDKALGNDVVDDGQVVLIIHN
jgi:hypothetical protein